MVLNEIRVENKSRKRGLLLYKMELTGEEIYSRRYLYLYRSIKVDRIALHKRCDGRFSNTLK